MPRIILDSFKYVAIDKDDERSDEKKVSIEFIFFKVTDRKAKKFPVCWGEKIDGISSAKFSDFKDKVRQIVSEKLVCLRNGRFCWLG